MGKKKKQKNIKKKNIKNININNDNIKEKEINEPVKLKDETSVKIIIASGESSFNGKFYILLLRRLLGIFITIITFGLAYPFALCITYNYKIKNTTINGKKLKFDGSGADLLGKWIWWCILTIITFGLYAFFIPNMKKRWLVSHTHYESYEKNTEEDEHNQSAFTANIFKHIFLFFISLIMSIFSCGLFLPMAIFMMLDFSINNTKCDGEELEFTGNIIDFYINFLKWLGLTLITLGLYLIYFEVDFLKWKTKNTTKKGNNKNITPIKKIVQIPIIISFIIFVIAMPFILPSITNFINTLKMELDYAVQDEVYTGQAWGDQYALYLKYQIFTETDKANVSIVNVDEKKNPEIFIEYTDKEGNRITRFAYIKDDKVKGTRKYKNVNLKVLCTVEDEEYMWAIFVPDEDNSSNGTLHITNRIMKDDFKKIKYSPDDKEFKRKYVMRDISITYREIKKDDLHNDMNALIGDYEGDNYISASFTSEMEKQIENAKLEIEKEKRVDLGDYFIKYGTYKLYTNNLHSTVPLTEDDEVFDLKVGGVCHIKKSSKFGGTDIDKDCTYAVQETNTVIEGKKVANLVVSYEGGSTTYQVKENNEVSSSWYKLRLK